MTELVEEHDDRQDEQERHDRSRSTAAPEAQILPRKSITPSSPAMPRSSRKSCLKCLCGDFGQQLPRQRSRIMVNGDRIRDGSGLAHHAAACRSIQRRLDQRRNSGKSDLAVDEFGDRDFVRGIEHRRARPTGCAARATRGPSAGKRSRSGFSKVRLPISARSSRFAGPSMRSGSGQAMRDRDAHVGRARDARSPSRRGTRPCRGRSTGDAPGPRSRPDCRLKR